ncbi:MAG: hypothetical protein GQ574_00090 [Crocinitomix sp.]|nr:hypothetical protein [Crocinitomix sp.]
MIDQYINEGYVIVKNLLPTTLVDKIHQEIETIVNKWYSKGAKYYDTVSQYKNEKNSFWIVNNRLLEEAFIQHCSIQEIINTACKLMDTGGVSVLEDQFINKPPGCIGVNMHQDTSYFPLTKESKCITCWIPLCDLDEKLGPLIIYPGSHKYGTALPVENLHENSDGNDLLKQIDSEAPFIEPITLNVQKGDVVFFDCNVIHGSGINQSNLWRPAFSLHYASEESVFVEAKAKQNACPEIYEGIKNGSQPVTNKNIQFFKKN